MDTLTLKVNPVVAITGTETCLFSRDGVVVQGGVHLANLASAYMLRDHITMKNREPRRDPRTGQFSKAKRTVIYTVPYEVSTGVIKYAKYTLEVEYPPELPLEYNNNALDFMCQVADSNGPMGTFFNTGAL